MSSGSTFETWQGTVVFVCFYDLQRNNPSSRAALRTSLQPQNVREAQQDMRPLATRDQVEDAVGGWDSARLICLTCLRHHAYFPMVNSSPKWGGGPFAVKAGKLNDLQMEAVKQGLQRRFSVVQGPPGTGRACGWEGCTNEVTCPSQMNYFHWPGKTTFLVHLVTSLANLEVNPTVSRVRTGKTCIEALVN